MPQGGHTREHGPRQVPRYSPPIPAANGQKCGAWGHHIQRCPEKGTKQRPECSECGEYHWSRECARLAPGREALIAAKKMMEKAREELRRAELRFNSIEEEAHYMEGGWERVDAIQNGTAGPMSGNSRQRHGNLNNTTYNKTAGGHTRTHG